MGTKMTGSRLMATVLFVGVAALAGCAGTRFSFEEARQIKVGMTEAEVTERLGRPYSVATRGDAQVWVWSYANGLTGGHRSISFIFKEGKVHAVPSIPSSF